MDVGQKWEGEGTVLIFHPEQTMKLMRVVVVVDDDDYDYVVYCYEANLTTDITRRKSEINFVCMSLNIRHIQRSLK
jgi:hypothetical protein